MNKENILSMYESMRNQYSYYEVYEGAETPTGHGRYLGATPIYEQAEAAVRNAKTSGKVCFIKGVKPDGTKIYLL